MHGGLALVIFPDQQVAELRHGPDHGFEETWVVLDLLAEGQVLHAGMESAIKENNLQGQRITLCVFSGNPGLLATSVKNRSTLPNFMRAFDSNFCVAARLNDG